MTKTRVDIGCSLQTAEQRIGRLEARLLLQQATGLTASTLAAYPERLLDAPALAVYQALVARREQSEPISYLLGSR